jgi:hypothetical protein
VAALAVVAAGAFAVWLTVALTVPPARLLTYLAFFTPLWICLAAGGTIAAYAADALSGRLSELGRCGRRGALFATFVIANLALFAAHRWNVVLFAGAAVAAAGWDLFRQRRGRV